MRRFGIRYSDRWRFTDGQRRLTLREIWANLQYLPDDAPLVTVLNTNQRRWSVEANMLADLIEVQSGRPYYARPEVAAKRKAEAEKKQKAQDKVRAIFQERRAAMGGE